MGRESPRKDVTNPIGLYGRTNSHKAYGRGKKGNGRNGSPVGYTGRYLYPNNTQSMEERKKVM